MIIFLLIFPEGPLRLTRRLKTCFKSLRLSVVLTFSHKSKGQVKGHHYSLTEEVVKHAFKAPKHWNYTCSPDQTLTDCNRKDDKMMKFTKKSHTSDKREEFNYLHVKKYTFLSFFRSDLKKTCLQNCTNTTYF